MRALMYFLGLLAETVSVASTPPLLQPRQTETCSTPSGNGTCISTSSCSGTSVSGYCSGAADLECCVVTCSTPIGPGFCESTSQTCSGGSFVSGHCPGAADIECCVATCSTPSGAGFCSWTGSTCPDGNYVSGFCPGPAGIECCVAPCSTPSGSGHCEYTTSTCSGSFEAGYCSGPSNYECCVTSGNSTGNSTSGTGLSGLDISGTPDASFWSCAASSYQVIAIEGYIQGCAVVKGGEVKSNFVSSYTAAKNAGFANIDAYLFPCTGTQPTNVTCKDPATQLGEFLAAIDSNNMTLDYLWLDIEPTVSPPDACNAWNLGDDENEALAKEWVSLMIGSGRNWGIYANGNQWASMFASRDTDIGSQLPLWAVQDDYTPGVNTVDTFMGGWTSAVAKQYYLGTTACGMSVDLDSFLS